MSTKDRSGQFRRDLGWKTTATGGRAQQRFHLGHDPNAAAVAAWRLAQFCVGLERHFERERDGEACRWEGWSLDSAEQIAGGKMVVTAAVPEHAGTHDDRPVAAVGWFALLETCFGTICGMEPAEPTAAADSAAVLARRGESHLDLGRRMLATVGRPPTGGTLHAAVDAYVARLHAVHRTADGAVRQTGEKQGERAVASRPTTRTSRCPT